MSEVTPTLTRTVSARIPTPEGEFQLCHYTNTHDHREHLALILGDIGDTERLLVRVHSECFTGDVLGSLRCDCGDQLHQAMQMIADAGRGMIIYLRQEGRGIGLEQKLRAYNLQDEGYDTVEANLMLGHQADERDYWAAAAILADQRVRSINLLTNNPAKIAELRALGVVVNDRTAVVPQVHAHNHDYLATKVQRMNHLLQVGKAPPALPAPAALPAQVPAAGREGFPPPVRGALDALRAAMAAHSRGANGHQRATNGHSRRPWVTLTWAQSLDGSITTATRESLKLSGAQSMRLTHTLRTLHDAILVGVGTVLDDDPSLTARGPDRRLLAGVQPQPVVLDSHGRFPATARLLNHPLRPWLATLALEPARRAELEASGLTLIETPSDDGRVDLDALLEALARRGVRNVMVEGGAQVIGAFLRRQLVDEVVVTLAPRLLGGLAAVGGPATNWQALPHLAAPRYTPLGDDLLVWAAPHWEVKPARA